MFFSGHAKNIRGMIPINLISLEFLVNIYFYSEILLSIIIYKKGALFFELKRGRKQL